MENMRFTSGRVGENVWRLAFGVRSSAFRRSEFGVSAFGKLFVLVLVVVLVLENWLLPRIAPRYR